MVASSPGLRFQLRVRESPVDRAPSLLWSSLWTAGAVALEGVAGDRYMFGVRKEKVKA